MAHPLRGRTLSEHRLLPPITNYHLPFTIHQLPITIHHLPFTNYHLPFTIYHLPFTIYQSPNPPIQNPPYSFPISRLGTPLSEKLRFGCRETEFPGQLRSQTEFGNEVNHTKVTNVTIHHSQFYFAYQMGQLFNSCSLALPPHPFAWWSLFKRASGIARCGYRCEWYRRH